MKVLLFTITSLLFISSYFYNPTENENLIMGNPSNAVTDVNSPNNYLLIKKQYSLSYNKSKCIANWVSWRLDKKWLTETEIVKRKNKFISDNELPTGWYRVKTKDYTSTGFSRGHSCPSADRFCTQKDNDQTFLLTNIFPQTQANNNGPWGDLEDYCRQLAESGNELYIFAGGYGSGGTGLKGKRTKIANKVCVPAKTWKVVMVLPEGEDDLHRVTKTTRLIAVVMNNDLGPFNKWYTYKVSVDSVENLTGYNFYSNVPDSIENDIEAKIDHLDIQ